MTETSRWYVIPPTIGTEPETDSELVEPKYLDDDRVQKYHSGQVPVPEGLEDHFGVDAGDSIFIVYVTGDDAALDELEESAGDIIRITSGSSPAMTVSPEQAAEYLNRKFLYRSPEEWKEKFLADGF